MTRMTYRPIETGIRDLARSPQLQAVALEGARSIAATASADDPRGAYAARPAVVTSGWRNERRAGAVVEEVERGDGADRRTLVRAAAGTGSTGLVRYTTRSGRERLATEAQVAVWTRGSR